MDDSVRVNLEADGEERTARVRADAGEVTAGDATFRFSVDGVTGSRDDSSAGDEGGADEDPRFVAPLDAVPTDGTLRCEAVDDRHITEFILWRDGDAVLGWRNSCPHKPKVRLDTGGGAIVGDGEIVCHEHGARFDCDDDGYCTRGPCRGEELDDVDVAVREGDVYITDERFERARRLD